LRNKNAVTEKIQAVEFVAFCVKNKCGQTGFKFKAHFKIVLNLNEQLSDEIFFRIKYDSESPRPDMIKSFLVLF
jgi:hypothetical protein